MSIYRIHVSLEEDEDIVRIIDIPGNSSLQHLHLAILSAVNFDTSQLASFYISDKSWDKGQEITLVDMDNDEGALTMDQFKLSDLLKIKDDRLVYVYDYVLMWTFHLRLLDTNAPEQSNVTYPLLIDESGESPKQYEDKDRYPGEISEEDQKIMNSIKRNGLDIFNDDYNEDDGLDENGY